MMLLAQGLEGWVAIAGGVVALCIVFAALVANFVTVRLEGKNTRERVGEVKSDVAHLGRKLDTLTQSVNAHAASCDPSHAATKVALEGIGQRLDRHREDLQALQQQKRGGAGDWKP